MYRFRIIIVFLFMPCILTGCRADVHKRHHVVALLDASASIAPISFADAIHSSQTVIKLLQRGDRLSVLPVLSKATQMQGSVLRFDVPEEREPYDADLSKLYRSVAKALTDLQTSVREHPTEKTDILGALDVVAEEFALDGADVQHTLIIFSDFLEDDGRFNFVTAPELGAERTAKKLAGDLAEQNHHVLKAKAYLGLLRSNDYDALAPARRRAVLTFWSTLLQRYGAKTTIATDGPGLLKHFLGSPATQ